MTESCGWLRWDRQVHHAGINNNKTPYASCQANTAQAKLLLHSGSMPDELFAMFGRQITVLRKHVLLLFRPAKST